MSLGTADELRDQIIAVALDRAFLADPLPTDADSFKARQEGRTRLNLIAQEVARLAGSRCWPSTPPPSASSRTAGPPKEVADDITQLQR
jgi:ATP-dependent helicase HrpA